jgi:hypothetical protein
MGARVVLACCAFFVLCSGEMGTPVISTVNNSILLNASRILIANLANSSAPTMDLIEVLFSMQNQV